MMDGPERSHLLDGRVVLEQPVKGYRVAVDAVLAAAAVPATPGQTVLDVGAGTGAIGLCLAARIDKLAIAAIEREPGHAELARRNIALNQRDDCIDLTETDLFDLPKDLRRDFDQVVTNPPFHEAGSHRLPEDASRAAAGHQTRTLAEWLNACTKRLRSGGWLTCIHKAEALPEMLAALTPVCGDLRVMPIWPRHESPAAKRVIVLGRKASQGPMRLMQGLTLHGPDNSYTDAAQAILRRCQQFGDWS